MSEDELIEKMARAAEPAAHGPAWELAKEAQRRALAAIREAVGDPLTLVAHIRKLEERDTKLSEATAQVLDDMGKKSLNCCGAAKAELRAALGEWPDLDFTLADAQAIIDACDYRKGTPNV